MRNPAQALLKLVLVAEPWVRIPRMQRHHLQLLVLILSMIFICGCNQQSFYEFIPTPQLYLHGGGDPFDAVPADQRNPAAEVIYITDRTPLEVSARGQEYGYDRSRSAAFGTMNVHFGEDLTWDKLIAQSRAPKRERGMTVTCSNIKEIARYTPTPPPLDFTTNPPKITAAAKATNDKADEAFRATIAARMAKTNDKTIYVFVHGYHCEFEWSPYVIAQLWHFMGRGGVPVAYSWPAASPGLLRGYQYDRESGEFTVHHLKQFLELIASCPEVEKVNILSHSRGTDVLTSALRELRYKSETPHEAGDKLKLGVVILAAADIDAEVATQRLAAPGVIAMADQMTLYVNRTDSALGTSTWMYGSNRRLGTLRPTDLKAPGIEILLRYPQFEIVDARVTTPKIFSHSYFFAHPAGNSDLIQLFRDGRLAGAANGRPLERDDAGFWILKDDTYGKVGAAKP